MNRRSFKLQIITPQRVLYNAEVESLKAPGAMGSLQVLYGHIPFLTPLEVGEIAIGHVGQEGAEEFIATSGGVLQVERDGAAILTETAEWAQEIEVERAEKAMMRAKERLSRKDLAIDVQRAQAALARAINRIKVSKRIKL